MHHRIVPIDHPCQQLLANVSRISDEAFQRRVWANSGIRPVSVENLLALDGTALFVGFTPSDEIAGFSIGTVLNPQTIRYFGLESERPYSSGDCPFSALKPMPGDYHLTWRAVASAHLHQGWGQSLTLARLGAAARLGCSRAFSETILTNAGTVAMHGNLGFKIYRRTRHLSDGGFYERVYFFRQLSPD